MAREDRVEMVALADPAAQEGLVATEAEAAAVHHRPRGEPQHQYRETFRRAVCHPMGLAGSAKASTIQRGFGSRTYPKRQR